MSLARMGYASKTDWAELLKSPRILIVSEAGAGKTYECQTKQHELWDEGEAAFYLDLAGLAHSNLRDMLSSKEVERFEKWLVAEGETATFFLDSYDELKLSLGSFEQALKSFERALAGRLSRVSVIITTRPVPMDQDLIRRYLPVPDKLEIGELTSAEEFARIVVTRGREEKAAEETQSPDWRNVALMPLLDAQIRQMAAIQGVADVDAFMHDIHARNAEEFARRPQDLIELCADWQSDHSIRTHRDQVATNITIKLKPRTDGPERVELSDEKAFEGASRLALAAALTRKLTIRHSAKADKNPAIEAALNPATILADWTQAERETLLERALFGFATYGRVRFHHRSVVEYLAAERLTVRLKGGMPIRSLKRLLFTETAQNKPVVRPSMRPIAAWIAAQNDSIFEEVRNRDPSVLFDYGDPASLQPGQRVVALRAFVERYGPGDWRGLRIPHLQVRRYATSDLSAEINRLWAAGIENSEVRELLLGMIEAGEINACADIAYEQVGRSELSSSERIDAVDALAALDDKRLPAIVSSIENDVAKWPSKLTRSVIVRLFPKHMPVATFCRILRRVEEPARAVGELSWHLPDIIASAEIVHVDLDALRAGLDALVTDGMQWEEKKWPHLAPNRPFLLPAFCAVCLRLVREGHTDKAVLRSTSVALRLSERDSGQDKPSLQLREFIAAAPSTVRELAFWENDAFLRSYHDFKDGWRRLHELTNHSVMFLTPDDGEWVRRALVDQSRPLPEREMMLSAAMSEVWDRNGSSDDNLISLKRLVSDSNELITAIDARLRAPKSNPALRKMERESAKTKKQQERREAKAIASWIGLWREIEKNPDEMFGPAKVDNTAWNLFTAMERSGEHKTASGWNRRFIERHFSKDVADRLRLALMLYWRTAEPPTLASERAEGERNTILVRWSLGLAGIAAEAEVPAWAKSLSPQQAEIAARYAPIDFGGLPAWLEPLVVAHSDSVDAVLGAELSLAMGTQAVMHGHEWLLQELGSAAPPVVALFLPRLMAWLIGAVRSRRKIDRTTAAADRMRRTAELLLRYGDSSTATAIVAMVRHRLTRNFGTPSVDVWLPILLRLDPAKGVGVLEREFAKITPAKDSVAVGWVASLFGDRNGGTSVNPRGQLFTPKLQLRLARLAYQHVRPDDDVYREGSFTPGVRDDAQHGRSNVLSALLDAGGPEGWSAKLALTEDPLFAHLKDRALTLANEKSAEEADSTAFTESDVVALNKAGESAPATRDSMFELMRDRLDDLDDLLLRDTSPREAWGNNQEEYVLRRVIALELRNRSNGAYTVDQEAATADEKETDIRLRSISGQQAVIELKVGEKDRSAAVLRATLRDQLVKKYMASEECRAGCLLITIRGERTWHHPNTNQAITFEELIEMLNLEAAQIMAEMGGSLRLMARGLDLRPRLLTEKKAKAARTKAGAR
ncbi:hypothetical protein BH10PSE14_BH10PSE14_40570 [soil metagenome]